MRLALSLLLSLLPSFACTADPWDPGQEIAWHGLGDEVALEVFIPKDYDSTRSWPLLYLFHGTGGRPSTKLYQRYTEGLGFILVAAPYAIPGAESLSRAGVLAEIRRISKVRRLLSEASLRLDDRTYVGGFSKGGWMSDLLATQGFDTLTGALILGAGRIPTDVGRVLAREKATPTSPLSIYVGIGQLDANHLYSRRAATHYRQLKHQVVLEEYLGRAHRPGEGDSPYLRQWLRIQTSEKESLREDASAWWEARLAKSKDIASPMERLLYLEHLRAAPYADFVSEDKRAALSSMLNRASRHPSLRPEVDARQSYHSAQQAEEKFRKSSELPDLAQTFKRIHSRAPETYFGQRAALDLLRLQDNYRVLRQSRSKTAETNTFPKLPNGTEDLKKRFLQCDRRLRS